MNKTPTLRTRNYFYFLFAICFASSLPVDLFSALVRSCSPNLIKDHATGLVENAGAIVNVIFII